MTHDRRAAEGHVASSFGGWASSWWEAASRARQIWTVMGAALTGLVWAFGMGAGATVILGTYRQLPAQVENLGSELALHEGAFKLYHDSASDALAAIPKVERRVERLERLETSQDSVNDRILRTLERIDQKQDENATANRCLIDALFAETSGRSCVRLVH